MAMVTMETAMAMGTTEMAMVTMETAMVMEMETTTTSTTISLLTDNVFVSALSTLAPIPRSAEIPKDLVPFATKPLVSGS